VSSCRAAPILALVASATLAAAERAPPLPRAPVRKPLDDKTLKEYGRDCLRSGCHARINEGPWAHGPSATGACGVCHLAQEGAEHRFKAARPKEEECTYCHTMPPVQAVAHAPYSKGECWACHDPHRGETRQFLKAKTAQDLCSRCHEGRRDSDSGKVLRDIGKEISRAPIKHGPVAQGDCAACHFSHSAPNGHLLAGKFEESFYVKWSEEAFEFCFRCHDRRLAEEERGTSTGFRDGDRNLHFVHVRREKGRSCAVCHETHAAEHEKLLRDFVPFGRGEWKLPIGHRPGPSGGSCQSGCHQEFAYDNSNPPPPQERRPTPRSAK